MSALFAWLWIVGGLPAVVLGEVVRAESPRVARTGRIAFALLLGFDLLLAAVVFSAGAGLSAVNMTRGIWWVTIVLAGVPLALVSGLAVRRGYAGHRLALLAATLTTAVLYVAFPLGFVAAGQRLTGLGRFEHNHHVLGVAILLIPTLILLVTELRWKQQEVESVPEGSPDVRAGSSRVIPRSALVGAGILLILIWLSGTNGPGLLLGLGVVLACSAVWLWRKHRSEMRSVLGDLRPPKKS